MRSLRLLAALLPSLALASPPLPDARFDWSAPDARVTLEVRNVEGQAVLAQVVLLEALRPAAQPLS